jgi:hypothetical protein
MLVIILQEHVLIGGKRWIIKNKKNFPADIPTDKRSKAVLNHLKAALMINSNYLLLLILLSVDCLHLLLVTDIFLLSIEQGNDKYCSQ